MGATRRSGVVVGAVVIGSVVAGLTIPIWLRLAPPHTPVGLVLVIATVSSTVIALGGVLLAERDASRVAGRLVGERERAQRQAFLRRGLPFVVDQPAFDVLVDCEVARLPGWVRVALAERRVVVASEDEQEGQPWVLGLYRTRPVGGGAIAWGGQTIDVDPLIVLYRSPLIRHARSPDRLVSVVRETLLHEVGHALGMSEDDLNRYSIGNEPLPDAVPGRPQ